MSNEIESTVEYADENGKRRKHGKPHLSFSLRMERYFNGPAIKHIAIALIANTMLAQLFFNSAGSVLPDAGWQWRILILSSIFSTAAFCLFEYLQMRRINNMRNSGVHYARVDWAINVVTQLVVTAFNCYALALFNYAIWPSTDKPVHLHGLPGPNQIPAQDWGHAGFYSTILLLVAFVGERKQTSEERVAQAEEETVNKMLDDAQKEAFGMIDGEMGNGRAITAMVAIGSVRAKRFFGNFYNAMTGKITIDDVVTHANVDGIIVPRAKIAQLPAPETIDKPQEVVVAVNHEAPVTSPPANRDLKPTETIVAIAALAPAAQPITSIDDPRLLAIPLPEGWTLESIKPQSHIAQAFGIAAGAIADKLEGLPFTPGTRGAKLYEVWQALAWLLNHGNELQPAFQTSERYSETSPDMIAAYAESAA